MQLRLRLIFFECFSYIFSTSKQTVLIAILVFILSVLLFTQFYIFVVESFALVFMVHYFSLDLMKDVCFQYVTTMQRSVVHLIRQYIKFIFNL